MNNYYENNSKKYIEDTINCNMNEQYDFFLKCMPAKGKILDIGFGSGRDMIYFASKGYEVKGIDPTMSFVKNMKDKGFDVCQLSVEDLNYKEEFDGIWACASLLHVKRKDLYETLKKCKNALKFGGVMYCSFKYGDYEITRDGRYFNYLNEQTISGFTQMDNLKIIDIRISYDVRNNRSKEKWLNVLLKKL